MMIANVSFGIAAFGPIGWVFVASTILLEGALLSWWLSNSLTSRRAYTTAASVNVVSGLVGVLGSSRYWWLVLWIPWVSDKEVQFSQLESLVVYYLVAFVLSVLIEMVVAAVLLRRRRGPGKIALAIIGINVVSYFLGSFALYKFSGAFSEALSSL